MATDIKTVIKLLEDVRDEFEYNRAEYSNPGVHRDPYEYGVWQGKEDAYEDAKYQLDEVIIKLKKKDGHE